MDFIYELSNRINFVANYRFNLSKQPLTPEITTKNLFTTSFLYYLENQIYKGITTSLQKSGKNPKLMGVTMTIQYKLF